MTKAIARDPIYRGRRFQSETIELCVRWYITYRLSYRDLVAMMAERGIVLSHTTILRWVLRYVPEFEKRWARYARRVNPSWRIDETSIPVRGRWHYLYRAVDKYGKSVDFLLCADRGMDAAQAFFRKAVDTRGLYLHVMRNGGRYWRYNYRINRKRRTLALGVYPDVSVATARIRHQDARRKLAEGIDPSIEKQASRKALSALHDSNSGP